MQQMLRRKCNPGRTSRRLTNLPLAGEITILLIIKVGLITVLAKTFFAHPEATHMRMPTASVEQRMLAPTRGDATPVIPPTPETISITE